jgi:hypothetical protein
MYRRWDTRACEATGHELEYQDSISGRNRFSLFDNVSNLSLCPSQPLMQ